MYKYIVLNEMPKSKSDLRATCQCGMVMRIKDKNIVFVREKDSNRPIAYYTGSQGTMQGGWGTPYINGALRQLFSHSTTIYDEDDYSYIKNHLKSHNVKLLSDKKLRSVLCSIKNAPNAKITKRDVPKLGVELELESDRRPNLRSLKNELKRFSSTLINAVVIDPSVRGGTEIRFEHPCFARWSFKAVAKMFKYLREKEFGNATATAGMHVHASFKNFALTVKAGERFNQHRQYWKEILYPICARSPKLRGRECIEEWRYGLGANMTRSFTKHGTFELRVFEATTNPYVFKARVKFTDYFVRFLASDLPVEDFFRQMSNSDKKNYEFLLKTDNPHAFGLPTEDMLVKLYA